MEDIKIFTKEGSLSVLNDPFSTQTIESVTVRVYKGYFNGAFTASGTVKFKNGNTKGEQEFTGESFDHITQQIKSFIETLNH